MPSQQQAVTQQQREVETQEHHAKASASAGLNLNLFGALSGALSSHSRKETHRQPSGEEKSVEERDTKGTSMFRLPSSVQGALERKSKRGYVLTLTL
jgi:hypothetical protein